MDDYAEEILRQSHETLNRTASIGKKEPELVLPPMEDRVEKWKRQGEEIDRARAAEVARRRAAESERQAHALDHLQMLMKQYVAAEIKASRKFMLEVMAGVVAEERTKMLKKIDDLRAELTVDKSKVIDLNKKSA
jgi:alanyl-tRNA synthetase